MRSLLLQTPLDLDQTQLWNLWPAALRTLVSAMLDSSLAQSIVWGPRRLLLYNDAYVPFLGSKHPVAFGKELDQVWPEIWTDIGPLVDSARSGESHQLEDMPLTLTRHGKNDRSWFTFYYSPVRDESGVIQGMCSSVVETTRRVLAENRQAAMLEFSDALSTAREAAPLIEMAVKACRDYLEECSIEVCDAVAAGLAVQDYRNLEQGLVVRTHLPDKPAGCDARMLLPVVQAGRLAAVLDIRNAQVASWTEMDVSFAQEICSRARTWLDKLAAAADLIEVKESERRLRSLADALPQIIWITDAEGRSQYFNRQWSQYTGVTFNHSTADEIAASLLHPDDGELTMERFNEARRTGGVFEVEHRIRSRNGEYRWFLVRAEPQRDPVTGEVVQWIGASVDIQDRRLAEERLQIEDRRKDEFLATLAHELRNPLAPIRTGLQIVKLAPAGGVSSSNALAIMERQLSHMVRLIDDLLDISRIRSGKVALKMETVELRAVVETAVEASRPLIDVGRHTLTLHLPGQPLCLHADSARLTQVVSNILNNAAKYMRQGGSIDLRLQRTENQATLAIEDTGVGIPADMLPRVFDMFTQVGKSLERADGGLGIGLSISRTLVEMHGGTIEAQSAGPDLGSTFTIRLPLTDVREPSSEDTSAALAAQGAGRKVLVIDDNADAAETLATLLQILGCESRIANSGLQALAAVADFTPDLVFCDIGMPLMSGYEVARRLRSNPALSTTTLIALTGWGSADDKQQALGAGFSLHLTKPLDAAELQRVFTRLSR